MKLLTPIHHSIGDWDKTPNALYSLSADDYVDAPTSLKIGGAACTEEGTPFLCRLVDTRVLPQGRLTTWHKGDPVAGTTHLYFRNQAALGTSNNENTYYVLIMGNMWRLYRMIADAQTLLGQNAMVTEDDLFYYDRITWWNGLNPHCDPALVVMLERYNGDIWVQQGDWLYDTTNQWAASAINRCGPGCNQLNDVEVFIDMTKIEGPS